MFELPLPNFDRAAERLECEIESEMSRTPIATVDVQGLGPQRAGLRRYLRWLADERAELGRLESIRARLVAGLDAPAHEASRSGAIARHAARILAWIERDAIGSPPVPPTSETAEIMDAANRRAVNEAQAEAMQPALAEIDRKLHVQRMRVDALARRQPEFVHAAVAEEAASVRELYVAQVSALNETINYLAGAQIAANRIPDKPVMLPGLGLNIDRSELYVGNTPDVKAWEEITAKWLDE